jgi:Ca2+-binding EF-hand superfamily protein
LLLRDAANEDRILERAFAFFDKDGNGEIDVAELR